VWRNINIQASSVLEIALERIAYAVNQLNQTITSDKDYMRLYVPPYPILSHKLIELSRKELSRRDNASNFVVSGKIRRCSGNAVMPIKESLNIAKIHVRFRGNR
jgi:hypothetical protein